MRRHATVKLFDSAGDVVADQAHSFDAFDPALGWFVGEPGFDLDVIRSIDTGFTAQHNNPVHVAEQIGVDGLWMLSSDVDADLGERFG
jgi:hypothetical protein